MSPKAIAKNRVACSTEHLPEVTSPDMNCSDAGWAGASLNHLSLQDHLNILFLPIARDLFQQLVHSMLIHQKLTCGYRSSTADTGSDYNKLVCIRDQESCHNRVIFIFIVFSLLV